MTNGQIYLQKTRATVVMKDILLTDVGRDEGGLHLQELVGLAFSILLQSLFTSLAGAGVALGKGLLSVGAAVGGTAVSGLFLGVRAVGAGLYSGAKGLGSSLKDGVECLMGSGSGSDDESETAAWRSRCCW